MDYDPGRGNSGEDIARVPPNDQEAELAILSACLLDKDALNFACENVKAEDFYRPDYKAVFEAMYELFLRNLPLDLITLRNKLEERRVLEQIGGRQALMSIAGYTSTSANVRHYCHIVAEKSILRRIISASRAIHLAGFDASKSSDEVIEFAEKSIFDIAQNRNSQSLTSMRELMNISLETIETLHSKGSDLTGLETGFRDLDRMTSGLQKSDLILIAARPSMGKSALALNIAQYAAIRNKVPVAFFSLEMSKEQLALRMICTEALIDSNRLRVGKLGDDEWERLAECIGPLSDAPIYIDDTPGISVTELRTKCRRLKLEKGLGLVVVDYLQLMSGATRTDNRQQEISEISRMMKAIAREIQTPVIALSQLSRKNESRSDHRPMLSDLRDSGAIEQDADIVAFIHREDYYKPDTEKKNVAEIIIGKHRNGPTNTIELIWRGEFTKFVNKV
jgi:replicative DNA helicase